MITELMLVEGVSDVLLISYYLQNVYGWNHEKKNQLGMVAFDDYERIENLTKNGNQLILCGIGGNGKFQHFVDQHRITSMIAERDISSLIVVTDRDNSSTKKIEIRISKVIEGVLLKSGEWKSNVIMDSFGQKKMIDTYLLIIPEDKSGALEKVIIDALKDIPEEAELMEEVMQFIDSLKEGVVPELNNENKADKAAVGTFFSARSPQNAMRSFGVFISQIDWGKSDSLNKLFIPFGCLGKDKRS